jgi:hypothetical protein
MREIIDVVETTRPATLQDIAAAAKYLAFGLSMGWRDGDAAVAATLAEALGNLAADAS